VDAPTAHMMVSAILCVMISCKAMYKSQVQFVSVAINMFRPIHCTTRKSPYRLHLSTTYGQNLANITGAPNNAKQLPRPVPCSTRGPLPSACRLLARCLLPLPLPLRPAQIARVLGTRRGKKGHMWLIVNMMSLNTLHMYMILVTLVMVPLQMLPYSMHMPTNTMLRMR
jgi:hypothetical protein